MESFIDLVEKVYYTTKSLEDQNLLENISKYGNASLLEKISSPTVMLLLVRYWKRVREGKQRGSCIRKFWINPDWNDPHEYYAFRKDKPDKKQKSLRPNQRKQEKQRKRTIEVRDQTVKYLIQDLIPNLWNREATKESLDKIHDYTFDLKYEERKRQRN